MQHPLGGLERGRERERENGEHLRQRAEGHLRWMIRRPLAARTWDDRVERLTWADVVAGPRACAFNLTHRRQRYSSTKARGSRHRGPTVVDTQAPISILPVAGSVLVGLDDAATGR